ncbi:hypothetical protein EYF80_044381 [Liparis tanakae]|uniref:Uncharacterized protein n=1 Tax=Liparis tanakae TaxID=230148 RepID=A0A4Z2FX16_9TELE|nr:hypothetical protein EYF80_044381 [Liparis tanakae]
MYWEAAVPSGVGHHSMAQTGPPAHSNMSQRSGWAGFAENLVNRAELKKVKKLSLLFLPFFFFICFNIRIEVLVFCSVAVTTFPLLAFTPCENVKNHQSLTY